MTRQKITTIIGEDFHTANIEEDEYSYVKAAGSKDKLAKALGHDVGEHFKLDRRFCDKATNTVVLVETKQEFVSALEAANEANLSTYMSTEDFDAAYDRLEAVTQQINGVQKEKNDQ